MSTCVEMQCYKKGGDSLRENFASTGQHTNFRSLMIIATILCLMYDYIDVNTACTAFLYADLIEPIHMYMQFLCTKCLQRFKCHSCSDTFSQCVDEQCIRFMTL